MQTQSVICIIVRALNAKQALYKSVYLNQRSFALYPFHVPSLKVTHSLLQHVVLLNCSIAHTLNVNDRSKLCGLLKRALLLLFKAIECTILI